ncbi:hypothetical protein [Psychromonas sp. Urea-02u-13]|uniref:hypothetical protein n=1 Tax=Psychromonas sp. Urea-02u-13 TaxID=2058326 RepID=UPI000C33B261|nr:hypothetical protein [Psychromonas sp. Urea-02u-13]PKG37087.1 hypothetical protein CXF74_20745 [Psychromonas sp. Urea-02u-13]
MSKMSNWLLLGAGLVSTPLISAENVQPLPSIRVDSTQGINGPGTYVRAVKPITVEQSDSYITDLNELGFLLDSVDARPKVLGDGGDTFDENYNPGKDVVEIGVIHELGYDASFENSNYRYHHILDDAHQFGDYGSKQYSFDITSMDYLEHQPPLSAWEPLGPTSIKMRSNRAVTDAVVKMNNEAIPSASGLITIDHSSSLKMEMHYSEGLPLTVTLNDVAGKLIPFLFENDHRIKYEELTGLLDVVYLDTDQDGNDDRLVVLVNGKIYVYKFYNDVVTDTILSAAYEISHKYQGETDGRISLSSLVDKNLNTEHLVVVGTKNGNSRNYELSTTNVIRLGSTGYLTVASISHSGFYTPDSKSKLSNLNMFDATQVQLPIDDNGKNSPRLAIGGFVPTEQQLGVRLIRLDYNPGTRHYDIIHEGYSNWTNPSWHDSSFYNNRSIAAADIHGVGVDYIAFGNMILEYGNHHHSRLGGIESFSLGDSTNYLFWVSGNFVDDNNEWLAQNFDPIQLMDADKFVRSEGEELALFTVETNGDHGYRVKKVRIVDVDNRYYEDLVDESTVLMKYGVADVTLLINSILTSPLSSYEVNLKNDCDLLDGKQPCQWLISMPPVYSHNLEGTDSGLGKARPDLHKITLSTMQLLGISDVVPYYAEASDRQSGSYSEIGFGSAHGSEYEYSNSITAGVSSKIKVMGFSVAVAANYARTWGNSISNDSSTTVGYLVTPETGPILQMIIVPYDNHHYQIINSPAALNIPRGEIIAVAAPRPAVNTLIRKSDYDAKNASLGNLFPSYDEYFTYEQGNPASYPTRLEVQESASESGHMLFESAVPLIIRDDIITQTNSLWVGRENGSQTGHEAGVELSLGVDKGISEVVGYEAEVSFGYVHNSTRATTIGKNFVNYVLMRGFGCKEPEPEPGEEPISCSLGLEPYYVYPYALISRGYFDNSEDRPDFYRFGTHKG